MARTVQTLRLSLFTLLLGTVAMPAAPLATDGASTAHRLLLFGGEEAVRSGYYALANGQQKLGDVFFTFGYNFNSESRLNTYLYGNVGYGAAKYTLGGTSPWMKMLGLKLGGGLRYAISEETDLRIGGAYQSAHFVAGTPTGGHGYEAQASLSYHPWLGEWNPYLRANLRYAGTSVDFQGANSSTHSVIGKIRAGIFTPVFAHPFGQALRIEVYGTALTLHGDMPRLLGTRYLWNIGTTAYLQSPVLQDWINDLTLGVKMIRGEKFKGLSVGVGVKF